MELMEEHEELASDIFEECNNREIKNEDLKEICSNDSILMENCNESGLNQKQFENVLKYNKHTNNNNNHNIVPVGIIIVLMTIYLGMTSVQKCLVNCVAENTVKEQQKLTNQELLIDLYQTTSAESSIILERLLEYKDICKDLEIFTKDKNSQNENENTENEKPSSREMLKDIQVISDGSASVEDGSSINMDNNVASGGDSSGNGSGSGSCMKESRNKNKKSKYSIKSAASAKNGFNKYNKSSKAKYHKNNNNKKELNLNKKNSTAEPIIYLFALVFIYLLLKAASDINQHYKSQNKNDKRLRRCSLQSYAQTHRPDRRASKAIELALKQKQLQQQQQRSKNLSTLSSSHQDEQFHSTQTQHLLDVLPAQKSEQQQQPQQQQQYISKPSSSIRCRMSYSSNWQLLRQHTTTQSVDNSDLLTNTVGGSGKEFSSRLMARRCSVPVALSCPRQKISTVSPSTIVSDHNVNICLSRRTSITSSPLTLAMDTTDSFLPETKRRVRMINRH